MCFSERPNDANNSSEDVFDLLIEDDVREEVEIQLRHTNVFFNEFFQIPIDEVSLSLIDEVDESLFLVQ